LTGNGDAGKERLFFQSTSCSEALWRFRVKFALTLADDPAKLSIVKPME
jgi:hypothetical protein